MSVDSVEDILRLFQGLQPIEVLQNLVHDARSPVNSIVLALTLLSSDESLDGAEREEIIATITQSAKSLQIMLEAATGYIGSITSKPRYV